MSTDRTVVKGCSWDRPACHSARGLAHMAIPACRFEPADTSCGRNQSLLRAERDQWIDGCCAPGGEIARDQRGAHQHE
jgi:hypothetical protein